MRDRPRSFIVITAKLVVRKGTGYRVLLSSDAWSTSPTVHDVQRTAERALKKLLAQKITR